MVLSGFVFAELNSAEDGQGSTFTSARGAERRSPIGSITPVAIDCKRIGLGSRAGHFHSLCNMKYNTAEHTNLQCTQSFFYGE